MHEASIAQGILDAVEQALDGRGPVRVRAVRVRIGRLAGVENGCLRFAWDVLREDGPARGATLEIEEVPVTARCEACGDTYEVEDLSLACPRCGGLRVEMLTGRELVVSEIEADEPMPEEGSAT